MLRRKYFLLGSETAMGHVPRVTGKERLKSSAICGKYTVPIPMPKWRRWDNAWAENHGGAISSGWRTRSEKSWKVRRERKLLSCAIKQKQPKKGHETDIKHQSGSWRKVCSIIIDVILKIDGITHWINCWKMRYLPLLQSSQGLFGQGLVHVVAKLYLELFSLTFVNVPQRSASFHTFSFAFVCCLQIVYSFEC